MSGPRVIRSIPEMQTASDAMRSAGERVGLVPTMGFLHEGHQSLIRLAGRKADKVVVSVFVNPTQFGPGEDHARYPRDFDRDLECISSSGGHIVFAPTADEMYPEGFATGVTVDGLSEILEGASRPGHFKGVATVVTKLFTSVKPHAAIFGRKDAQQVAVIRRLVRDLNLDVEIIVAPTIRHADGLAQSSRNMYLSADERLQSTVLFQALSEVERQLRAGVRNPRELEAAMVRVIGRSELAGIDYVAVRDAETFEEVDEVRSPAVAVLAVRFGKARLIDNQFLDPGSLSKVPDRP